jgi:hypothetical protein
MPKNTLLLVGGLMGGAIIGLFGSILWCMSKKTAESGVKIRKITHNHHIFEAETRKVKHPPRQANSYPDQNFR